MATGRSYDGLWKKRHVLAPWIIQMISAIIVGGVGCWELVVAAEATTQTSNGTVIHEAASILTATAGVLVAFFLLTIIFDIVEIVLFARKKFHPVCALIFAILKVLMWGIYFILTIVSAVRGVVSGLGIFFGLCLFATSVTQLVFGALFTHRWRTGGRGFYKQQAMESGFQPGFEPYRGQGPAPSYGQPQAGMEMHPPQGGNYPHYNQSYPQYS